MYCFKQKKLKCDGADEVGALLRTGAKVAMKKHTCIYKGAKECVVCKAFYDNFEQIQT